MKGVFTMFKKKRIQATSHTYNPTTHKPILKCSICTGEQVAGFKELHTGKFEDVMLIRNDKDLQIFMQTYGITEPIPKEY